MAIEFTESADKHGIDHDDALWAMTNAHYLEPNFDVPRVPGHARPTLVIGPSRGTDGPVLEVMFEPVPPRTIVVFHVMIARAKFLNRLHRRDP